jgi:hypothetical protein
MCLDCVIDEIVKTKKIKVLGDYGMSMDALADAVREGHADDPDALSEADKRDLIEYISSMSTPVDTANRHDMRSEEDDPGLVRFINAANTPVNHEIMAEDVPLLDIPEVHSDIQVLSGPSRDQ